MKKIRGKTYLHKSAILSLNDDSVSKIESAITHLPSNCKWNIIRIDTSNRICFLYYPRFEEDPHPSLVHSFLVDLNSLEIKFRNGSKGNPPILHRKETFLNPNNKNYHKFSRLTQQEVKEGLLDPKISHKIGFKKYWEELLDKKGLKIFNHQIKPKPQ